MSIPIPLLSDDYSKVVVLVFERQHIYLLCWMIPHHISVHNSFILQISIYVPAQNGAKFPYVSKHSLAPGSGKD